LTVERLAKHLLEHERVAFGAFVDHGGELRADLLGVEDGSDHLCDLVGRDRLHRHHLSEPRPLPDLDHARQGVSAVQLVASIRREDHDAAVDEPARDVVQQVAGRAVRPVDVVEHEEQRPLPRPVLEQRDDRLEHPQLGVRGVGGGRTRGTVSELREELRQLGGRRAERGPHLARVVLVEVVPDRLDERQVRERELRLGAASPQNGAAELPCASRELVREPGLADPRLAGDEHEPPVAAVGGKKRVLELRELLPAADEDGRANALQHLPILASGPTGGESRYRLTAPRRARRPGPKIGRAHV
jgi:hypothetical protein